MTFLSVQNRPKFSPSFPNFAHGVCFYLRRRLASGAVTIGVTLSRCVCVRHISLGGEGNALYPVLSSLIRKQR